MMLIGKTAIWLLRHSVQRFVKSRRLVCAHARNHITRSVKVAINCVIAVVLVDAGARPEYHVWGGLEPRAWRAREREPITGVWGGAPSGVQGQSPWSGGSGGRSLPEAENLLASRCATEAANLPHSPQFANSLLQFNNSYKRDSQTQQWRRKQFESAGAHGEPPAGSMGRAPGQGPGGAKPP